MRKKTQEKRQIILDAAKSVFLEMGYETSSVSDVAERASASKATVYGYFPSKEILLMEVMLAAGKEHGESSFNELVATESLREGLCRLGERHLEFIFKPETTALARVAITESTRSHVGREFYTRGPATLIDRLANYLSAAVKREKLRDEDPRWMAEHLKALIEAGITERLLFGDTPQVEPQRHRVCAERAVDIFLSFYGFAETDVVTRDT